MTIADAKDPEEIVDASFDFTEEANGSAVGSPVVTVSVVEGVDADSANTLQGAPTLQGQVVFQRFRNGVNKAAYKLRCKVTLADGRVLVRSLTIPVRSA